MRSDPMRLRAMYLLLRITVGISWFVTPIVVADEALVKKEGQTQRSTSLQRQTPTRETGQNGPCSRGSGPRFHEAWYAGEKI